MVLKNENSLFLNFMLKLKNKFLWFFYSFETHTVYIINSYVPCCIFKIGRSSESRLLWFILKYHLTKSKLT